VRPDRVRTVAPATSRRGRWQTVSTGTLARATSARHGPSAARWAPGDNRHTSRQGPAIAMHIAYHEGVAVAGTLLVGATTWPELTVDRVPDGCWSPAIGSPLQVRPASRCRRLAGCWTCRAGTCCPGLSTRTSIPASPPGFPRAPTASASRRGGRPPPPSWMGWLRAAGCWSASGTCTASRCHRRRWPSLSWTPRPVGGGQTSCVTGVDGPPASCGSTHAGPRWQRHWPRPNSTWAPSR
jgi:hypothetical protein